MKMQRLLGLDIGDRYIGIAVSDPLGITAQPYRTYKRATRDEDLDFFRDLIEQYNVKTLVCGLPLNMDGTESTQTRKAKNYAGFLKNHTDVENIEFIDETLTSVEADQILEESGIKGRRARKEKIDTLAAQIILQNYLDGVEDGRS